MVLLNHLLLISSSNVIVYALKNNTKGTLLDIKVILIEQCPLFSILGACSYSKMELVLVFRFFQYFTFPLLRFILKILLKIILQHNVRIYVIQWSAANSPFHFHIVYSNIPKINVKITQGFPFCWFSLLYAM